MTAVVTIVTVSVDLIAAVVIGIVIASGLFISRVGKSIVRRLLSGEQIRSWKMRPRAESELLERHGRIIAVVELQGPLFFGSAEHLADRVRSLVGEGAAYVILDMKRVNAIDSTGGHILLRIKRSLESEKNFLLLSHLRENRTLWGYLASMNAAGKLDGSRIFPDTDSALEWAEDHLLEGLAPSPAESEDIALSQMEVLNGLAPEETRIVHAKMCHLTFGKGEEILAEGDAGRDLYFLKKGAVTAKINLPGKQCQKRLCTYSPGIVFGEVAFLDGGRRSAGMWAHEDCELLHLPFAQFQDLQARRPELAAKLITQIALVLGRRLRRISDQVRLLEDDEESECPAPGGRAEYGATFRTAGYPGPGRVTS
jgi:CRP-like cAMP-binding protein/anti-anti-sigma regulatory factor